MGIDTALNGHARFLAGRYIFHTRPKEFFAPTPTPFAFRIRDSVNLVLPRIIAIDKKQVELRTMDGGDTVRGGLLHFRKVDAICAQLRKTSDRTGAQYDQNYFRFKTFVAIFKTRGWP